MIDTIEINGETIPCDQIKSAEVRCAPEERPFQGDFRRFKPGPTIVKKVVLKNGRVMEEVADNPNYTPD